MQQGKLKELPTSLGGFFIKLIRRTSAGRLHLLPDVGKIPLMDATLIEDPSETGNDDEESLCSASTQSSNLSATDAVNANNRDFKILVDGKSGQRHSIHLVAPTAQDKEAWISDISQCLDNIHMHSLLSPGIGGTSGGELMALKACENKCLMFLICQSQSFNIYRSSSAES